jgi:2'-5' RNA ligase
MTSPKGNLGFSIWLMPPSSYKPTSTLTNLTTSTFPTSANFPQSPSFPTHVTLTGSIPPPPNPILPSLNLELLSPPTIKFGQLGHNDEYFKYIFLQVEKTESLVALAKYIRTYILPDSKPFDENLYDPHISLVYSSEKQTEKRIEYVAWKTSLAIGGSSGWTGGRVALVDTRSPDVNEWKIVEEWSFPEA